MSVVDQLPWKVGNHFVNANVPGKPYTDENEMTNYTNDTNMAQGVQEGNNTRRMNVTMRVALVQEDKG